MRLFLNQITIALWLTLSMLVTAVAQASQTLVTIDDKAITSADLETALSSSPFYTGFNTMDIEEQAAMRGDMLKRLVTAKLLEAEARRSQLEQGSAFAADMEEYLNGIRYQKYLQQLRQSIALNDDERRLLRQQYADSADAYAAARSSTVAQRYQALYQLTLQKLRDQYHVKLHEDRITADLAPDTVLAESDKFQIRYSDIPMQSQAEFNQHDILESLFQQLEYELIVTAAKADNIDVSNQQQRYTEQRLPAMLLETRIKQWAPDDTTLRDYFDAHPELHRLKDWWHIGQLVVESKQQAEALQKKIISGESSLFQLAEQYSIDPSARTNSGDLGWVLQGTGMPEIEAGINKLDINEISPVIKTARGYHLITVLDRRPGATQSYTQIKDKLKQMIVSEKMQNYLAELQQKHKVKWLVMENDQKKARALLNHQNTNSE